MKVAMHCPFCTLPPDRVRRENELAIWLFDAFPVSSGHSLVVPKRHIGSFFEATKEERAAMLQLLDEAQAFVRDRWNPSAFNIGVNDGPAAGQTIGHLHMHLIPRFDGDVPDPRGGVRWVLPEKADYWTKR
jgi:diadenosine tetraphosphate (Ap4A) HIT family hydrolase